MKDEDESKDAEPKEWTCSLTLTAREAVGVTTALCIYEKVCEVLAMGEDPAEIAAIGERLDKLTDEAEVDDQD